MSTEEIQMKRPAEINEYLTNYRQASEYQKKGPNGKVLPDESLEKRGRSKKCCLKFESDPTKKAEAHEQSR